MGDMRNGDSLRDLYFQSPYIKRFPTNNNTPFSKEQDSGNKENVSPLSGGNLWIGGGILKSGGGTGSTASGNTTVNTPINKMISVRSPQLGLINSAQNSNYELEDMQCDDISEQVED